MLQVYTGNGKGKTTAAIGLAIRSLGAGHRVYIMQFMKSLAYSEQKILQGFAPQPLLRTTGKPCFLAREGMLSAAELAAWGDRVVVFPPGKPPADYVRLIEKGFQEVLDEITVGRYGLVILDEINTAFFFGLLQPAAFDALLEVLPRGTELVCTGRGAPDWLLEKADLITEMKEIRHYYSKGITARRGIEN